MAAVLSARLSATLCPGAHRPRAAAVSVSGTRTPAAGSPAPTSSAQPATPAAAHQAHSQQREWQQQQQQVAQGGGTSYEQGGAHPNLSALEFEEALETRDDPSCVLLHPSQARHVTVLEPHEASAVPLPQYTGTTYIHNAGGHHRQSYDNAPSPSLSSVAGVDDLRHAANPVPIVVTTRGVDNQAQFRASAASQHSLGEEALETLDMPVGYPDMPELRPGALRQVRIIRQGGRPQAQHGDGANSA